ncbi:diacylglycerol kinase [Pseudomonas sp. NyZ704]|nr:diacylglycerol kinase [Pseudomonas sp. NyZ704]
MKPHIQNCNSASALKGGKGLARILKATGYSIAGLKAAFRLEAAFRQLSLLALLLIPVACWLDVTRAERALLIAAPLLALAIELINSSIEAAVDRVSLELHPLSKQSKDMASAAQFIGMNIVAAVWLVILI